MNEHTATASGIADHFKRKIDAREITDGVQLPSIRQVAEQFKTTPTTAARAYKILCMEGWARATAGSGHAATYRVHEFATLRQPVNGMRMRGEILLPGDVSEILSAKMTITGGWIADILGCEAGDLAPLRKGRVLRNDRVIRSSHSWYTPEIGQLVPELLDVNQRDTVELIESRLGRKTKVTADSFTADMVTSDQADVYGMRKDEPIVVRHTSRHDGESVIEHGTTWFPKGTVLTIEFSDPDADM